VPFASIVQVQGDFNNWRHGSPLYSEENGYWSVDQGGTVIGQHYNHLITNAATVAVLTHFDPYSRPFKTAAVNLIAPSDIPHPDASYTTPSFPEAEILRRAQIS